MTLCYLIGRSPNPIAPYLLGDCLPIWRVRRWTDCPFLGVTSWLAPGRNNVDSYPEAQAVASRPIKANCGIGLCRLGPVFHSRL